MSVREGNTPPAATDMEPAGYQGLLPPQHELDPAAALVIATLQAMGDDAYRQVQDAMRGWDRADYEGDYPFGQDDENKPRR